jgi:hypothetical protein
MPQAGAALKVGNKGRLHQTHCTDDEPKERLGINGQKIRRAIEDNWRFERLAVEGPGIPARRPADGHQRGNEN